MVAKKRKAPPRPRRVMKAAGKRGRVPTGRGPKGALGNKWTKEEEAVLRRLRSPAAIQDFLDSLAYDGADHYYSVRSTLRTRRAHCMGGALVAACCLQRIGLGPPRVVAFDAKNDDTHAVAVFQVGGYWGAVGKSNFTLIRSRDPVYRSLRELMMSYFDFYFNTRREKSMVGYTRPFNLEKIGESWKFAEGNIDDDLDDFDDEDKNPFLPVRPPGMRRGTLSRASQAVLQAGLLGSNPKGLYKPR